MRVKNSIPACSFFCRRQGADVFSLGGILQNSGILASLKTFARALAFKAYARFPLRAPVALPEPRQGGRQIFLDLSVIIKNDLATGIQRATRALAWEILQNPPCGYAARPVYAERGTAGYFYAEAASGPDGVFSKSSKPVSAGSGDIFLGLDLAVVPVLAQRENLNRLRAAGVKIYFVLYDIIPITHPEYFPPGLKSLHGAWLKLAACYDGLLCISKAEAEQVQSWLEQNSPAPADAEKIFWFHLGGDIKNSRPTKGLPKDAASLLERMGKSVCLLMVGTIEPRKGHEQVIAAFEILWAGGCDALLVLAGKAGWKVDKLISKLERNRNERLIWLRQASDEYLEKIYRSCSAVLVASEREGFGLSVVEGAEYGKPLLLRDIPVFREIAGENASYFKADDARELAEFLKLWLAKYNEGSVPLSSGMKTLTWKQSAKMLLSRLPLEKMEHAA